MSIALGLVMVPKDMTFAFLFCRALSSIKLVGCNVEVFNVVNAFVPCLATCLFCHCAQIMRL